MRRAILTTLFLLAFTSLLSASDISGSPSGYTYDPATGYYFLNGQAYSRTEVDNGQWVWERTGGGYYSNCCYHANYGWVWHANLSYSYAPVQLKVDAPDFEDRIIRLAAARDRVEGELRKEAQRHTARLELIDKLGLAQNFHWQNYGVGGGMQYRAGPYGPANNGYASVGNNATVGGFGTQGTTGYGYTYNDLYGIDWNVNLQQAAMLVKGAQDYTSSAHTGYQGTLNSLGGNQAATAQIPLQGIAVKQASVGIAEALRSARAAPQSSQGSGSGVVTPGSPPSPANANPADPPPVMEKVGVAPFAAANACMACHSGANVKGKFDVTQWSRLTPQSKKDIVTQLLLSDDPKVRMPKDKPALAMKDVKEFLNH